MHVSNLHPLKVPLFRVPFSIPRQTMRTLQKFLLFFVVILHVVGNKYSSEDNFNRRANHQDVTREMVRYWSRPDVLKYLPRGVKEYVEVYIQKYPQYQYVPPPPPRREPPSCCATATIDYWIISPPPKSQKTKDCVILK